MGEPPNASLALGTLLGAQPEPRGLAGAPTALKVQQSKLQGPALSQEGWRGSLALPRPWQRIWLPGELPAAPRAIFWNVCVSPRVRAALAGTQAAQIAQSRRAEQEKVIPVPSVLQLEFQPRVRLGGSESLFNSDHEESQTVTAGTIQVSPFVRSLGLRPHPFLLGCSCRENLGDSLGIKGPPRHFVLSPSTASNLSPANQVGINPLGWTALEGPD